VWSNLPAAKLGTKALGVDIVPAVTSIETAGMSLLATPPPPQPVRAAASAGITSFHMEIS
jgi:hypothetical protein